MTSAADVGGTAVEVEPSHQFGCCATDDRSGAVWLNGIWHGSAYETRVCMEVALKVMPPISSHGNYNS